MKTWLLFTTIIAISYVSAQCQNIGGDHYLVEFDEFTPPTKDLIASFEGFPSVPFLAPDIKGTEHFLGNYKGKNVVLWFWKLDCTSCVSQIKDLNVLQSRYRDKLQIISLSDNSKAEMLDFIKSTPVDFPIIYKAKTLGDGPYAGELGYPRMFVINEFGVIVKVLPSEAFTDSTNTLGALESILTGLE